ncbi:hypothetical protein [Eubacterium oxidoreducens]|uniref:Uncharacterized protein n=1 Tax=Eubacterium oxidoreducens TaxID=1732 RepID=A0A1G6B2M4_EUBOX|nr:hypothetical protein [Eubacterium oxidoreducens]SDB14703.1 hypothetical protein SAMN02910417_01070 [Eubacterium oxidoreducens]
MTKRMVCKEIMESLSSSFPDSGQNGIYAKADICDAIILLCDHITKNYKTIEHDGRKRRFSGIAKEHEYLKVSRELTDTIKRLCK